MSSERLTNWIFAYFLNNRKKNTRVPVSLRWKVMIMLEETSMNVILSGGNQEETCSTPAIPRKAQTHNRLDMD